MKLNKAQISAIAGLLRKKDKAINDAKIQEIKDSGVYQEQAKVIRQYLESTPYGYTQNSRGTQISEEAIFRDLLQKACEDAGLLIGYFSKDYDTQVVLATIDAKDMEELKKTLGLE